MNPNRVWCYNELNEEDIQLITEQQIIDTYYNAFCEELKKQNKIPTEDECIAEWAVIFWAWPLKKTGEK